MRKLKTSLKLTVGLYTTEISLVPKESPDTVEETTMITTQWIILMSLMEEEMAVRVSRIMQTR
jgi:hypothetical protein